MITKTKTRTFETAYRSLEALVQEIETRELGLEEGIAKFEQGLALAQFCKDRLTTVENKMVTIKKKFAKVFDMKAPDDEDGAGRDTDDEEETKELGDDETGADDTEEDQTS